MTILSELEGKDPDEIADYLRSKGIKGIMGSTSYCPIARYLSSTLGPEVLVAVSGIAAYVQGVPYTLERPVQEFINRFDRGKFPDMMEGTCDQHP